MGARDLTDIYPLKKAEEIKSDARATASPWRNYNDAGSYKAKR